MFCKQCGNEIANDAAFCPNCGTATKEAPAATVCANCGNAVPAGAVACPTCGAGEAPQAQVAYVQPAPAAPAAPYVQKSRLAAGLLGIFLGAYGVHNFYLGFTGKAVAQLLITVLTCGAGALVSSVWGLIEGILLLTQHDKTDAKGVPLKD